jgi:hypothetical protein
MMNKVNNEFRTMPGDGYSVVSPEELVQCEGGILPLIGVFLAVAGIVTGAAAVVVTVFTFGFPSGDLFAKYRL